MTDGTRPLRFRWTTARAAGLAAVACLALSCAPRAIPERSNILLITVDTLRADHLSSYGYARRTSPVIDRLAAEGVRFDQAAVQWPKTGPSFASMMTATYSKDNGVVRKVGVVIPTELRMLAEELRDAGYATHAVVSNGAVASDFNFHQGFDTYIESWKLPPSERFPDPTRADAVTELARTVIEGLDADKPYFLWVHYLDPHFPYTPPGEWSEKFQGDEHWDGTFRIPIDPTKAKRDMVEIGAKQVLDGRDELAFYVARYDAEIAYNDAWIGTLFELLEAGGWLDNTLTVFTSDHGESLGEHHYYFDHGRFGFQTCLRVPLVFHYPGVLEPRVDGDPVELIDLAPTLLETAGVALPDGVWMQGRSLAPRLFGREDGGRAPRYAFSEAGYGSDGRWQKIVRTDRFKFVDAQEGGEQRWIVGQVGKRYALYDLENDPGETVNAIEEFPEIAERLRRLLDRWVASSFDALVDAPGEIAPGEMDEKTRDQLKALGYLN